MLVLFFSFWNYKIHKASRFKKQKQLNIHNAIIKGMNEKYEQEKPELKKQKRKLFFDLEKQKII